ncbi:MAG: LysM peptidoglycan-binding domain-containing protein [Bdellovibrionota bacterium]
MLKPRYVVLAIVLGISVGLSACSSGGEVSPAGDEIPPLADAATDAVPGASDVPTDPTTPLPDSPEGEAAALSKLEGSPPPVDSAAAPPPPAGEPISAAPGGELAAAPAIPADAGTGGSETYSVQSGDTLMKIAFETYGDLYKWKSIYEANRDKISDPNHVSPGISLTLEKPSSPVVIDRNGEKYFIKSGDTLGTISDDVYGTRKKWKRLWENNKQLIQDPNKIFAGFYLYYTMTPEDREEADRNKQLKQAPMASAPVDDTRMPAAVMPPEGVPQAVAPIPGAPLGTN